MNKIILVVEDDECNTIHINWILEDAGFDAVSVWNAEDGFIEPGNRKFDLILMDINLDGGMNGKEAIRIIKSDPRTADIPVIAVIAVIAVTAGAVGEEKVAIYDSGVDEIVTKPID